MAISLSRNRDYDYEYQSDEPRLGRSILTGIGLGLIGLFFVWLLMPAPHPYFGINEKFSEAFDAACRVNIIGEGTGSGVLLDTGYVLTASHVIVDEEKNVDPNKKISVSFYNASGVASTYSATVVYAGIRDNTDFAVLQVHGDIKSNVKLEILPPYIGDELFTIGCMNGDLPHLTTGYSSLISNDGSGFGRASFTSYFGNSGGGVFNKNQNVIGLVTQIESDPMTLRLGFGIPHDDKFLFVQAEGRYRVFLSDWTEYTYASNIYYELKVQELEHLVVVVEEDGYDWEGFVINYFPLIGQILMVLLSGYLFWAYLFRK